MRATITNAVGVIGAIGLAIGTSVFAGAGQAAAATEVPVTCHSDNPYPWLPAFDYRPSARVDIAAKTGSGHVVFQVLPETSAVARYINTKTALCQAEIDVP